MRILIITLIIGLSLLFTFSFGSTSSQTHTVVKGDTLWNISQRYQTSVPTLKVLNNLPNNTIHLGQILIIKEQTPASQKTPKKLAPPKFKLPFLRSNQDDTGQRGEARAQSASTAADSILAKQIYLDRAGYRPGKIDGDRGRFTTLAYQLCPPNLYLQAKHQTSSITHSVAFPSHLLSYVNRNLPTTRSGHPDFKALSPDKSLLNYTSITELIAERYHCSTQFLKKLNPHLHLESLKGGEYVNVPNVSPFKVENIINAHTGVGTSALRRGKKSHNIVIDKKNKLLTVWRGASVIACFPITLKTRKGGTPEGQRTISSITAGPVYNFKKTGLKLRSGPNSPVGVVWCSIGNSYGIHGTNNPERIGRNESLGCIRLANWDIVKLASLINRGSHIQIVDSYTYPTHSRSGITVKPNRTL